MVTLVQSGTTIAIQSPYNRDFAYAARMHGGNWDRDRKLWVFDASRFNVTNLENLCKQYYPATAIADAFPVPAVEWPAVDLGFVGKAGETFTGDLEIFETKDFNGSYGPTRLHTMRDSVGHVFVWYASTARYRRTARQA